MGSRHYDQDKDSTLYVGNLDERCTDSLVWELMLQAGPVVNVHLPKDRVTQAHQSYGFVEFASEEDADYAAKIMNQIRVWGKPIRVNKASADRRGGPGSLATGEGGQSQGVGAELFVGNLDSMVDEKVLFETFSRFGPLVAPPKVARDEATNLSKGYGFISYASFDASDDAIANMHGQYLSNKEISVQYAYKKDGKGERHGDAAERALAAQAKKHGVSVPIPAMPAALVMPTGTPVAPSAMANGYPNHQQFPWGGGAVRTPQPPPSYNYGAYQPPPSYPPPPQHSPAPQAAYGGYNMPPPPSGFGGPPPGGMPPRQFSASPAQHGAPPPPGAAGLPARPPPSMAGYGGPPGMGGPPGGAPGFPPQSAPPGMQGYNRQPPPGYQGQR